MGDIYAADDYQAHNRFVPEQYSQSTKEIVRVLSTLNPYENKEWISYIAAIWETDLAYRMRGQDILQELNKENLKKNPKKEVFRLVDFLERREIADMGGQMPKIKILKKALKIALIFPRIKSAIRSFLEELNLEEIKLDINDRYWLSNKFDYNYEGKTYEERMVWRTEEEKDWIRPEPVPEKPRISINPLNQEFFSLNEEEAEKMAEGAKKAIMDAYKTQKV